MEEKMEKKPGLAVIISSKMKEKEEGKDDSKDGLQELAQMIISAVKEDDAEKFAKDLKSFIKMCCMEE